VFAEATTSRRRGRRTAAADDAVESSSSYALCEGVSNQPRDVAVVGQAGPVRRE